MLMRDGISSHNLHMFVRSRWYVLKHSAKENTYNMRRSIQTYHLKLEDGQGSIVKYLTCLSDFYFLLWKLHYA